MCSIPGLPTPGSDVTILITRVNLNPLCVLVEFWGNFDQERKAVYQRMRREIQFPREAFHESEGNPGDLCLVKIFETWYRARVVSRNGSNYNVFLIDEGRTLSATTSTLAWGQKDVFHLPPEVEFCVLANVLPLSPENRWSPMAIEFLKSLCGRTVTGYVQDVLVPHRTFLLDIPCISKQMYEMGFAKKLSTEKFKFFVARSLQSLSGAVAATDSQQISSMRNEPMETHSQIEKLQCYMYPELQTDTVETVIVTEVTNPLRIFCQLKVFSQELKKLTEQVTQHFEGRLGTAKGRPETLGSACASRGSDGKWYRSVLQQILPSNSIVEVLHVDYGKKDFVQFENIRPLCAEFLRMPVVTYVCSLHGIIDKGVGWTAAQINYLKSLILHRTVIAKFEYQSLSEGVHYVTLYGDENVNINRLFGMKEKCLVGSERTRGDYSIRKGVATQKCPDAVGNETQRYCPVPSYSAEEIQAKVAAESLPINSSHLAVVQYVDSPSEFWIQTQRYAKEFDQLMNEISDLYDSSTSAEGLVRNLTIGLFCAARSQDTVFYRAIVSEVIGKQVKVYFVDYGNTEIVDWYNVRVLPGKYQALPALAIKCSLAGIRPKDEKWSQSATVFFSKSVEDKILDMHVSAKSEGKYLIQLTDSSAHGEKNINRTLCIAGFAENDDPCKLVSKPLKRSLIFPSMQTTGQCPGTDKVRPVGNQALSANIPTVTEIRSVFKEHLFPIGSSVDVNVSYIESPNDFWCQIAQNSGSLNLLMKDIQTYYADSEFQQPLEPACIARHPDNRMWYRALVIQKHASPHVDVLFIDYGQTRKVSLQDLRPINPTFLNLKGQAFRCSLYNLIHPAGHSALEWSDAAMSEFENFVDSAASTHVGLKCTIYAVMYDSQKVVFNVVDLETPFQSVCSLLVQKGLADRAPPKKVPLPPFRLDTYYYSTHNIKTGGEEEVCITSVKSVDLFYCQLGRNSDLIEELSEKVSYLCHQLQCVNCPQTFGTVCFAKYTDGQWYRGQIKSTHPTIQVHFVDYGDTLEMKKTDLLPIPIEASEIMSVPVQAVECALSDVPTDVSSDINSWFTRKVTGHSFRALVVAKEPCGKLIVELYDGKTQLNAQIKENFKIETQRKHNLPHEQLDVTSKNMKGSFVRQEENMKPIDDYKPKLVLQNTEDRRKKEKIKPAFENSDRGFRQKQESMRKYNHVGIQWEPSEARKSENPQKLPTSQSDSEQNEDTTRAAHQHISKLEDLPLKFIKPGLLSEVYISHCNSPSSFFVQFTEDENKIVSVVEELNEKLLAVTPVDISKLQQDDLVSAMFPDDGFWYRAVVRSRLRNDIVNVEFIDFGNTATVVSSNICRLDKQFLDLPRFSTHCSLSGVCGINKEDEWDEEVVSKFRKAAGENAEKKLTCRFVQQTGSMWEVTLEDEGVMLAHTILDSGPTVTSMSKKPQSSTLENTLPEKSNDYEMDITTSIYKTPNISEGQAFEVYATSVVGPDHFWCQYAHSDELKMISELVEKVGNSGEDRAWNTAWSDALHSGSPCLAQFSEDEQWYRAEVITVNENILSVLFVDYGNESDVDQTSVKPIPPLLLKKPPQAFLCQLEGFDPSQGFWDDHAADHFFGLLSDEALQVTILKVQNVKDHRTAPYLVRVECKGEAINSTMKDYWNHYTLLDKSNLSENDKQSFSEVNVPLEIPSLGAAEDNLIQQNITMDVSPEHFDRTAALLPDAVPQCFGNKNEPKESNEMLETQLEIPVNIVPMENRFIKEDLELMSVSECVMGFNSVQYTAPSVRDEERSDSEDIPGEENDAESVTVDPSRNPILPIHHRKDSAETSFNFIDITDSASETSNVTSTSEDLPVCPPEIPVLEERAECVSEGTNKAEVSCETRTVSQEKAGGIDTCLAVSKPEDCTLAPSEETDILFETGSASVAEQTCAMDESDPLLYKVDESFDELSVLNEDQCPDVCTDSDIYEEVFKQCTAPVPKDVGPVLALPDQSFQNEDVEEDHVSGTESEFGNLKKAEKLCVGSHCVVWSYAHGFWCKGKIVKISEDSAQVLLLEEEEEAIVDLQNIFETVSETQVQVLGESVRAGAMVQQSHEEQMSRVTHLVLKVEDSDDDVIFVGEMQVPKPQVQEMDGNREVI
ncbi:tudor domain-containing 6 [Megalops cyprinoides]|uniref:tudor domain-containing 6 n=1 Tax=Megalops cyprinoides TaxID=118141 RepID=UPI001864C5DB|nr:tudor domain-containing 6 [Megalops cyprinoides]